jgi:hypothetical protein
MSDWLIVIAAGLSASVLGGIVCAVGFALWDYQRLQQCPECSRHDHERDGDGEGDGGEAGLGEAITAHAEDLTPEDQALIGITASAMSYLRVRGIQRGQR